MSYDNRVLKRVVLWTVILGTTLTGVNHTAAKNYELFIDIATEDDLYELLTARQINQDTFDTLHFLWREGLDINTANRNELYTLPNLTYADVDRIIAYRKEAGHLSNPSALVAAGVIEQHKFVAIAAFLRTGDRTAGQRKIRGKVRARSRMASQDSELAPGVLSARANYGREYRAAVAVLSTRDRLGSVYFEPNRGALMSTDPGYQYHIPKAYGYWRGEKAEVVVGTFRTGYAQRLTFDNSGRQYPNGLYPDDEIVWTADLVRQCREAAGELPNPECIEDRDNYITPDFSWRTSLLGVGARAPEIKLGDVKVEISGFASTQPKSIYQYEIYNRDTCADPDDDDNPGCSAPDVYKETDPVLDPTSRYTFRTLPNIYRESIAGGSVRVSPSDNFQIGVTGYGADVTWLAEGANLDFQEWSATPYGGPYGAVGMDLAWRRPGIDFFFEGSRSFDSMPDGGGGYAAIGRAVKAWRNHELDVSARYYGQDFANPYARPTSAPDEFEGLRARNEMGLRVRYTSQVKRKWRARGDADIWWEMADEVANISLYGRGDYELNHNLLLGGWVRYDNRDLETNGRMQCYEITAEQDEFGEPVPCAGERLQGGLRAKITGNHPISFIARAQYQILDDQRYDGKRRMDVSAFGLLAWQINNNLRMRSRLRYVFEDISDNEYLEQSIWAYVDVTYRVLRQYSLRLRYDLYQRIDDRLSSQARSPSPEHWFWLDASVQF